MTYRSAAGGFPALAAVAAVLLVVGSGPASAQEWLDKAARGLSKQLGLMGDTGPDIEYRERSPLVVPPDSNLPPPDTAAATSNPAWPKDPDAAANKPDKKADIPLITDPFLAAGRPIARSELEKGRLPRSQQTRRATAPTIEEMQEREGRPLTGSRLGYKGGLFSTILTPQKEEVVPFTGEPERTSLIEPPTGYRTPSPAQPYGITSKKNDAVIPSEKDRAVAR